jgi:UDP-GlcNAc:undecaprenyl-phosphate/decaprenyl-phosphate GlcNAc-1-phosphate transferase
VTAAIVTCFATGAVRVPGTRLGAVAAAYLASQFPALTRGFVYSSGVPAAVVAGGLNSRPSA